ncbi:putative Organic solute transport protein 1 [Trypanosoma vivax]|uniref:Uncharacterized protein n=1 Tax=Trypanosoma vivax (strain Y486) TaxID=1055687 RepID=G0TVL8_TRYVY|nr:hypothetical protein TRVL_02382 [Trypanosoma vivax]KAH8620622.1 putative Organic solute transport protein 1 [Trypanosoma vivax]CCC47984.1 conserved hypothetical protein [Trypanosoma vivax Y486]
MSDSSLPFLILNYGAEMIFILYERLVAQQVSQEMAQGALAGVVNHMFNDEFVSELLRPQQLYSFTATKELFTSLSQASVIRLSPSSMSKLFELMTVVLKYKLFVLRHPLELLELTWGCLEELLKVLPVEGQKCVMSVFPRLQEFFGQLTVGELASIRGQLLNFFSGRYTPVSILLEGGMQAQNGYFLLPLDECLPPLSVCEPPGRICYYNKGSLVSSSTFEHRDATLRHPSHVPLDGWNPRVRANTRLTGRVVNMYNTNRERGSKREKEKPQSVKSDPVQPEAPTRSEEEHCDHVREEINHLLRLVRGKKEGVQTGFKLSLFDHLDDRHGNKESGTDEGSAQATAVNRMSKKQLQAQNKELFGLADGLRLDKDPHRAPRSNSKPSNNLLDIMDES